ncbi:hypothetical protein GCM10027160_02890 [Streptomyces calidiresistens]
MRSIPRRGSSGKCRGPIVEWSFSGHPFSPAKAPYPLPHRARNTAPNEAEGEPHPRRRHREAPHPPRTAGARNGRAPAGRTGGGARPDGSHSRRITTFNAPVFPGSEKTP